MKLRNIEDVEAFLEVVRSCEGSVYLKSAEGDVLNLKSSLSRYVAVGRLVQESGNLLELTTTNPEDEEKIIAYMERHQ